jgi:50S ribosomal subunit-associated GTPase HflX|tara:strand:- start:318 stop:536 length:219 start_codon:yes stop_codon:yes gene_type:complete
MDIYKKSKAQSILEKHIEKLGSIHEKKEAEQKILEQKIKTINAELEHLKRKEQELATANSTNNYKYIKSMGS